MSGFLETLERADGDAFRWLNGGLHRLGSEAVDGALRAFNAMGDAWALAFVLGALAVLSRGGRAFLRRAAELALAEVAVMLAVSWSKHAIARPRPAGVFPEGFSDGSLSFAFGESGTRLGMPSGHATTAFALAVVLASWAGRLPAGGRRAAGRVLPFVAATLTALARVYAGMHRPGDVLVGALLGSLLAVGAIALLRVVLGDDRAAGNHRTEPVQSR